MQGQMFFQWSTTVTILFEGWLTTAWYLYVLSCLAALALAVCLEALRLAVHRVSHGPFVEKSRWRQIGESLLYAGYIGLSYVVMLIVMTYNVGLFVSVVLGFGIGHFVFPRTSRSEQGNLVDSKAFVALNGDEETPVCH